MVSGNHMHAGGSGPSTGMPMMARLQIAAVATMADTSYITQLHLAEPATVITVMLRFCKRLDFGPTIVYT